MLVSIIIIVIGLTGSAFISATEVALLGSRRFRISNLAERGDPRAVAVLEVLGNHEKFFGTILLLGNIFNIIVATVGTSLAITTIGKGEPSAASTIAATVIATVLIVIVGELTPKSVASLIAERWALNTARSVLFLMRVSGPLVWAFTLPPRGIVKLAGGREALMTPAVTSAELRLLIDQGEAAGTVDTSQGTMLENIFKFDELAVRDVMTPRPEIVWINADTSFGEFLETYWGHPHTRFPVYDDEHDDVVGILSVKDVMVSQSQRRFEPAQPVTQLMRPAMFVPETKYLDDLFAVMQESGDKIALAVDEFGGIAGLITLTRVVEQIVGRTGEEGLRPEPRFIEVNENTFVVDGGMPIDEANEELDLGIPEGDYETVAGFFLEQGQSIPEVGSRIRYGVLRMQISEMQENRISSIRVRRMPEVSVPASADAGLD
jgi:putative hemolysin